MKTESYPGCNIVSIIRNTHTVVSALEIKSKSYYIILIEKRLHIIIFNNEVKVIFENSLSSMYRQFNFIKEMSRQ